MGDWLLIDADVSALTDGQPHFATEQGQQLILTVAGHARDAHDFAAANIQVDAVQCAAERVRVVPGQSVYLQKIRRALGLRVRVNQVGSLTDHHLCQLPVRALARNTVPGHFAATQYRRTVTERTYFIELVADKENAATLASQPAQCHKEFIGFLWREH